MLNPIQTKKAIRLNRRFGQRLGWGSDRERIAEKLGHPAQSVSEQVFAEAVATFQTNNKPLVVDGVIGPATWSKLAAIVAFTPSPTSTPASGPKKKRRVIYYEEDVTAADLQVNDAYDLSLIELEDGNFELVMFMKLQFFFEDLETRKWSRQAKQQYAQMFCQKIQSAFNHRPVGTLDTGEKVRLRVKLQPQIEGFMADHWELTVKFTNPGDRSYVDTRRGNVVLSDNDLGEVTRYSCNPSEALCGPIKQTTAVHEFAHMMGLDDEYGPKWGGATRAGNDDEQSLLNVGGTIRPRHTTFLLLWVKDALLHGR